MSTESLPVFSRLAYPALVAGAARTDHARARGHAAGYAAGLAAAREQLAVEHAALEAEHAERLAALEERGRAHLAALAAARTALEARVAPVLEAAETVLAASALELAEAILGHELESDRAGHGAVAAVERAFGAAAGEQVVALRLNPADAALLSGDALPAGTELVADPFLSRGDAVAQLREGIVDARIRTAVDRVRAELASWASEAAVDTSRAEGAA